MANSLYSSSFNISQNPSWSSPFPYLVSLYFIYISIIELIFFIHINLNKMYPKLEGPNSYSHSDEKNIPLFQKH